MGTADQVMLHWLPFQWKILHVSSKHMGKTEQAMLQWQALPQLNYQLFWSKGIGHSRGNGFFRPTLFSTLLSILTDVFFNFAIYFEAEAMGTADRHICNIVIYFEAKAMGKADQHIFQHRYFDSKGTAKQHILQVCFQFWCHGNAYSWPKYFSTWSTSVQ